MTARHLSEKLEVSERTVYRDIVDLQASGVPIEGAAGVGYLMRAGYDLPPLMFSEAEVTALVAGARLIRAWGGAAMAQAAEESLSKIEAVLPDGLKDRIAQTEIHAIATPMTPQIRGAIDVLDQAVEKRQIIEIDYSDENARKTKRTVHPLALWFWGRSWTLVAWCTLRDDFRMFRIDRIEDLTLSGDCFVPQKGRLLTDLYRQMADHGWQGGPGG